MKEHVVEFHRLVSKKMNDGGSDKDAVHQAIETAYDRCIAPHMEKSFFLTTLAGLDDAVFAETVDHLFMPVNWSKVKMRTLWGIKNLVSGNLLTLERNPEAEAFTLKESSKNNENLDYAPMMTGDQNDAEIFIKMLQEVPGDAPLGINETMISLDIDEKVNPNNLEAVVVRVLF